MTNKKQCSRHSGETNLRILLLYSCHALGTDREGLLNYTRICLHQRSSLQFLQFCNRYEHPTRGRDPFSRSSKIGALREKHVEPLEDEEETLIVSGEEEEGRGASLEVMLLLP